MKKTISKMLNKIEDSYVLFTFLFPLFRIVLGTP